MAVGEARAVVAARALRLADEQLQAGALLAGEIVGFRRLRAGGERLGEAVEARLRRRQRALEGGDRLADIGEDRIHGIALVLAHRRPGGLLGIGAERAGIVRQPVERRQRPKDALVALVEILGHEVGIGGAVAGMLDRILERRQRLRPQAVAAAVPEEPGAPGDAGERHGAAVVGSRSRRRAADRPGTAGRSCGRWRRRRRRLRLRRWSKNSVAPSAAAAGESANRLVGIGRQRRQAGQRQRGDHRLLGVGKIRLAAAGKQRRAPPAQPSARRGMRSDHRLTASR